MRTTSERRCAASSTAFDLLDLQALSLHGSIMISFPLGPGRNEFGPAVVRVRTAKSAVASYHLLHAHFVGRQTAIVEIALTSDRAPRHLSGLADTKVEQHCHRYGHIAFALRIMSGLLAIVCPMSRYRRSQQQARLSFGECSAGLCVSPHLDALA